MTVLVWSCPQSSCCLQGTCSMDHFKGKIESWLLQACWWTWGSSMSISTICLPTYSMMACLGLLCLCPLWHLIAICWAQIAFRWFPTSLSHHVRATTEHVTTIWSNIASRIATKPQHQGKENWLITMLKTSYASSSSTLREHLHYVLSKGEKLHAMLFEKYVKFVEGFYLKGDSCQVQ